MTHVRAVLQGFYCDADRCTAFYEVEGTVREAWADAHAEGWLSSGGKHYCPIHEPERNREG